jgi:hypothetical protein
MILAAAGAAWFAWALIMLALTDSDTLNAGEPRVALAR